MLQYITENDCVKGSEVGQVHGFDIADQHPAAILGRQLSHFGIYFDAGYRASSFNHLGGQVSGSSANLEHLGGPFLIDPLKDFCVTAVWIDLLVDVTITRDIVLGIVVEPGAMESVFHCSFYAVVCIP